MQICSASIRGEAPCFWLKGSQADVSEFCEGPLLGLVVDQQLQASNNRATGKLSSKVGAWLCANEHAGDTVIAEHKVPPVQCVAYFSFSPKQCRRSDHQFVWLFS